MESGGGGREVKEVVSDKYHRRWSEGGERRRRRERVKEGVNERCEKTRIACLVLYDTIQILYTNSLVNLREIILHL